MPEQEKAKSTALRNDELFTVMDDLVRIVKERLLAIPNGKNREVGQVLQGFWAKLQSSLEDAASDWPADTIIKL